MGLKIKNSKNIITDGLVLNLDASDKLSYSGSGVTWTDRSGNGYNSTLINGPDFTSANGGAIVFDGASDRATFTTPIGASSSQTYEIWTNIIASSGAAAGFAYLLHNNSNNHSTGNSYLHIGVSSDGKYTASLNGQYVNMNTGVVASNSNIVQIILTWDGTTQKNYINAVLKNSESLSGSVQNFSTTTGMGDAVQAGANGYREVQGRVYSVKIYNKALTQAEISQNYNATKSRFGL
jgi:hypothetical protein